MVIAAPNYSESLDATQLLGSHFEIPDLPLSYDYVVVEGDTADLMMARRLASNFPFTVAIMETKSFYELDSDNYSEIPEYASQFTRNWS